ncbi:MAG: DUF2007 domain-containing protein [bacterium]
MNDSNEFCPACGAAIDADATACPECRLELSAKNAIVPDITRESDELISLFKLNDSMEAQLIKTLLEDDGIPCMVSEGGITSFFGASTGGEFSFTRVKVMVPASRAKDAIKSLAGHKKWSENELARYLSMLDEM